MFYIPINSSSEKSYYIDVESNQILYPLFKYFQNAKYDSLAPIEANECLTTYKILRYVK